LRKPKVKKLTHALAWFETLHRSCGYSYQRKAITGLILLATLSSCSSAISRLNQQALVYGLEPVSSSADGFILQSFYHPVNGQNKRLHVYLEGDGRPWENGLLPAAEPTTRTSVMLPLMAIDAVPALYLGRPCYNGHAADENCSTLLWTDARYGERVIASMTHALNEFTTRQNYQEIVLIGHSGGGTLALLMAERLPKTVAVITLAGNYDIDIWADHHSYPRLSESLNPAARQATGIPEWHLLGNHDSNIPPQLFQDSLRRRPNSTVEIVDADHNQGWQQIWPRLLQSQAQMR
jgi:predicted alpha/beta hydrolase family esterase